MSKLAWGIVVWYGGWLTVFAVLEGLALFWPRCPWPTLSTTTWNVEREWWPLQLLLLTGLALLLVHIVAGGPLKLAATVRARRAGR